MNIMNQFIPTFIKKNIRLSSEFIATPIITVKGNKQIYIENEYTLQTFTSEQIIIRYSEGDIEIIGDQLMITALYPEEIILQGTIKQILFHAAT